MGEFGVVLVGVDGSEVANAALVFAADEAFRRGSRLVVAHACRPPDPSAVAARGTAALEQVATYADIVREEVVATLAELQPKLDYDVVQRDADAAELLIDLSAAADLVVVGTYRAGRLRGFVLGSVSQRVAAQAACAVVTVSGPPGHDDGPIVLGVSAAGEGRATLDFACRSARLRNRPVQVIRAMQTEDWLSSIARRSRSSAPEPSLASAGSELDHILAQARTQYPDVTIDGTATGAGPFAALLQAAGSASLLVIGSQRGRPSTPPHLGPGTAWLLHQAPCPLAVVAGAPGDRLDQLTTANDGSR